MAKRKKQGKKETEKKDESKEQQEKSLLRKKPWEETEEEIIIEEGSLEGLTEQPAQEIEEEDFSEFMISPSGEALTPTLSSSFPTQTAEENLDEIGRSTPTPALREQKFVEEGKYLMAYNEPDYTAGRSEETILKGPAERGMMTRTFEEMRTVQPRVLIEDWKEGGESIEQRGRDDLREYIVAEPETRQEERRMPFEKMSSEYRVLKRKKAA